MKLPIFATTLILALAAFSAHANAQTSGGYTSDEITTPATCDNDACYQETSTGPIYTPGFDKCIPADNPCLVRPTIRPIKLSDGTTVDALCMGPASFVCMPESTVLAAGFVSTTYTVYDPQVSAPTVGLTTVSDIVLVDTEHVTITVCDNTECPFPTYSPGSFSTTAVISWSVAGTGDTIVVPILV